MNVISSGLADSIFATLLISSSGSPSMSASRISDISLVFIFRFILRTLYQSLYFRCNIVSFIYIQKQYFAAPIKNIIKIFIPCNLLNCGKNLIVYRPHKLNLSLKIFSAFTKFLDLKLLYLCIEVSYFLFYLLLQLVGENKLFILIISFHRF